MKFLGTSGPDLARVSWPTREPRLPVRDASGPTVLSMMKALLTPDPKLK